MFDITPYANLILLGLLVLGVIAVIAWARRVSRSLSRIATSLESLDRKSGVQPYRPPS